MPTMATPLRDPTAEFTPLLRERQTPPSSLDGKTIALTIKVGDNVIYSKYAGTEYTEAGTEYLVVRESDILATI